MSTLRAEFFVEPFVESRPGPHVTAALAAVEATGLAVEFGPFASTFDGGTLEVADAVRDLILAAFERGASRVQLEVALPS